MAKKKTFDPNKEALKGFAFLLPFFITNFVVALRLEPFYSLLGLIPQLRNTPLLPLGLLLLLPIGAFVSLKPVLSKKKPYFLNIIVSTLLIIIFAVIFSALAEELYRCDILQIPNCD